MSVSVAARTPLGSEQLMVTAARLYHVHGLRQRDIGERLGLSQTRVSRLLKQAEERRIVRTVVIPPDGLHPDLEDALEQELGLQEVHVVEVPDGVDLAAELGRVAARHFSETGISGGIVGFTSWSTTLQEMAHAILPGPRSNTAHLVEMLGDLGSPQRQHDATRSTRALAAALGAEAVFLRTPGVSPSVDAALQSGADPHVRRALELLDDLDIAFVGVGPADVHSRLSAGERFFTAEQLSSLRAAGAVGQLNQRFVDRHGRPVRTELDDLVVGVTLDQLARARRRVVVAGGHEKHAAIAAAVAGSWIDVLVTDVATARALSTHPTRRLSHRAIPA